MDITIKGVPLKQAIAEWRPSPNPREVHFLDFMAPKPATWIEHPPFRVNELTRLTAPGSNTSNAAEVAVLYYGHSVQAEEVIAAWANQFRPPNEDTIDRVEPMIRELEAAGTAITLVALAGDHIAPYTGYYRRGYALIGAVVRTDNGQIVIRFLGEQTTIDTRRGDFIALVEGIRLAPADPGGVPGE